MSRRFRVTANFPVLGTGDCHQVVIVEGSNWQVALGKAARAFKRLPVMHRRRVTALSMMVEQLEGQTVTDAEVNTRPMPEQTIIGSVTLEHDGSVIDDTVVTDADQLNQLADNEAERLIVESEEIVDDEN